MRILAVLNPIGWPVHVSGRTAVSETVVLG